MPNNKLYLDYVRVFVFDFGSVDKKKAYEKCVHRRGSIISALCSGENRETQLM